MGLGPIVSPWTVDLPSRRWLALALCAGALAAAVAAIPAARPTRAVASDPPVVEPLDLRLDRLARLHRAWVAEHGAGCARGLDHLAPYAADAGEPDPWGTPLVFRCDRSDAGRVIAVGVLSLGPDGAPGGGDDLLGADRQQLH